MEVVAVIVGWLLCGVVGSALSMEFFWRRGERPLDVDLADFGFFGFLALLGPLNLFVGSLFVVGWLYRQAFKATGIDPASVIFKARRQ